MSVKRPLCADNARQHPPSKIPVPARSYAPLAHIAGKTKVIEREDLPQTESKTLDSLRSKLEQSVDKFIKTRKELEEILSAEGSSQQAHILTGSSADLKAELKRHRELTFRVESSSRNKDTKNHCQGSRTKVSSSDMLKSIMG